MGFRTDSNRNEEHKELFSVHIGFALVLVSPLVRTIVNRISRVRCNVVHLLLRRVRRPFWNAVVGVGPPAWERACFNSPEWGGGSSPVETEPAQIVLLLLLFQTRFDDCV